MKKNIIFLSFFLIFTQSIFAQNSEDTKSAVLQNINSKMQLISGGTFSMGCENQEENEVPVHNVYVDSFFMSKTEVTQEEYLFVTGENFSTFVNPKNPVEEVSWYDAVVFCNKLSIIENLEPAYILNGETNPDFWGEIPRLGDSNEKLKIWNEIDWNKNSNGYRLPTEAEWEFAARGGLFASGNPYSGNENLDSAGWSKINSDKKTHECGLKEKNPLGLFDMTGNVWEWCWDWYGRYSSGAGINPTEQTHGSKNRKVRRGGSFKSEGQFCRVTNRASTEPQIRGRDSGFRLVRSSENTKKLALGENSFEIDTKAFPYSVLINSYADEKSAVLQKNRIEKSYITKEYSKNSGDIYFSLRLGYFQTLEEAQAVQNQLTKNGMTNTQVEKFSDAISDFDFLVKQNPVIYDNGSPDFSTSLSDSVISCLNLFPFDADFQLEYLEIADFDNLKLSEKNISNFMIEDFFSDSMENLHAASYAEYEDKISNRSLILVAAKSDENFFSDKAQNFAQSFMDGVYADGSFSMSYDNLTCTVVNPYGQQVLCGNSSDGSNYLLIFARGFKDDSFKMFLQKSLEQKSIASDSVIQKTLNILPDKNDFDNKSLLKLVLSKNENPEDSLEMSNYKTSVNGYWTLSFDFENISGKIDNLEYYFQANQKYQILKNENTTCSDIALFDFTPALVFTDADFSNLIFNQKSYIINLKTNSSQNVLTQFAKQMKIW